jgi:hypothetical protein
LKIKSLVNFVLSQVLLVVKVKFQYLKFQIPIFYLITLYIWNLGFVFCYFCSIFAVRSTNGVVAERLGSGLQNRLPRFESGRCL